MHIAHRSGLLHLHPAENLVFDGIDTNSNQVRIVTLANIRLFRCARHRHAGFATALASEHTSRSSRTGEPVYFIGTMAHCILQSTRHIKLFAVRLRIRCKQNAVQVIPHRHVLSRVTKNNFFQNSPVFKILAPASNFDFKTVVLGINGSGQHDYIIRNFGTIVFFTNHQSGMVDAFFGLLDKDFAEHVVHESSHLCAGAALDSSKEFKYGIFPAEPTERRI